MSRGTRQAVFLVAASVLLGFGLNAARREPLSMNAPLEPPPAPEPGANLPAASAEDALLRWEEGVFFLDVRPPGEWERLRVAGAFSLDATRFQDRYFEVVADLGLEMPLFLYGAGPDSFVVRRVAAELMDLGHAQVELAVCGLDGLLAAGLDADEGPAEDVP